MHPPVAKFFLLLLMSAVGNGIHAQVLRTPYSYTTSSTHPLTVTPSAERSEFLGAT